MFKALVGVLAFGCSTFVQTSGRSSGSSSVCHELNGSWHLRMIADDSGETVTGTIDWAGNGGKTHLVVESSEGTKEPIDDPIQNLRITGDSIRFTFAPIGFSLVGTCVVDDSMKGRFSVPQPPFEPSRGNWEMSKVASNH